ncbi:MAG: hypothetical protein EBX52_13250 [Proteobacteria bacterium]|nr:hypothetical protein [Pseudomonadota bacterium]
MDSQAIFYGSNTGVLDSKETQSHWTLAYEYHWVDGQKSALNPFVWAGWGLSRASSSFVITNSDPSFAGTAKIAGNGSNLGIGAGNRFFIGEQSSLSARLSLERYFIPEYTVSESTTSSFYPTRIIHNPHDILALALSLDWVYEL